MGKGDKKSRRGKIVNGSYGVKRPRKIYRYIDDEVEVEEKPKAKKAAEPKEEKSKAKKAPAKAKVEKEVKEPKAKKTTAKKKEEG